DEVTGPRSVKIWSLLLLVSFAGGAAYAQDKNDKTDKPDKPDKPDKNDDRAAEKKVERAAGGGVMDLDRVAAVVDNTIILESEVISRATPMLAAAEADQRTALDDAGKLQLWRTTFRKALDAMVEEQLIVDAASEAKLEVNEDEVQK